MDLVNACGLQVARTLYAFINDEALPGTGVAADTFWQGLAGLIADLAPRNAALLKRRDDLQREIDAWHRANPAKPIDIDAYTEFLRRIGYLQPEVGGFRDCDGERRSGDRQHRRAAARGSRDQCTLRAECRERPLG